MAAHKNPQRRFWRTCNDIALWDIIQLVYIQCLHDATLQVYRVNTCSLFFSIAFLFLFQKPAEWTWQIYPQNKLAKLTCGMNPPNWDTEMSRQIETPFYSAEWRRGFPPPKSDAILAREIDLPEQPPSPAQNSQAGPGPPTPPPRQLRVMEERGEGAGVSQAHQSILNRYFYFHPLYMVNYACSVWHNNLRIWYRGGSMNLWKYNYITFRRKELLQGGSEGPVPSGSSRGIVCIITDRRSAG